MLSPLFALVLLASPVDALVDEVARSCSGPEGVEDCKPGHFEKTFAGALPKLQANRDALTRIWLAELHESSPSAAYGLAWLGAKQALPELRKQLLADRYFYGWESSGGHSNLADDQFPHHQAFAAAIVALSGKPLAEAVKLTDVERNRLRTDSRCFAREPTACFAAQWLLTKL